MTLESREVISDLACSASNLSVDMLVLTLIISTPKLSISEVLTATSFCKLAMFDSAVDTLFCNTVMSVVFLLAVDVTEAMELELVCIRVLASTSLTLTNSPSMFT